MSTRARLRATSLPSAPTGIPVDLSAGRGPRIIAVVHSASCTQCRDFVRQLGDAAGSITEWGGRVSIVVCEPLESVGQIYDSVPAAFQVLADPHGKLELAAATLIIADEWGEIYSKVEAGSDHAFPSPTEIAEWTRFIAIQCPECEQPEGAWKTI